MTIALRSISTNHTSGRHLIVDMDAFAAVATFEPGDSLEVVCAKLRRLASDIDLLAKVDLPPRVTPGGKPT